MEDFAQQMGEHLEEYTGGGTHYHGEQCHCDDPRFPIVPPDLWKNKKGIYMPLPVEMRRAEYRTRMAKLRASAGNTFKKKCKHYVPGNMYEDIKGVFYIPPMADGDSSVHRLTITLLNANGEDCGKKSVIEWSNTALKGKAVEPVLLANAVQLNPSKGNDVRSCGSGHMAASGTRAYGGGMINYAGTYEGQEAVISKMSTYFSWAGFSTWVVQLRLATVQAGARAWCKEFGSFPWCTLQVVTRDYGNEEHVDTNDGGQGITIWHLSKCPRKNGKKPKVLNWYFLFPNIRVFVGGKWHDGFAIPLSHGTTVTWDAAVIRHCTAKLKKIDPDVVAYGSYFGAQTKVMDRAGMFNRFRPEPELTQDKKRVKKCLAEPKQDKK